MSWRAAWSVVVASVGGWGIASAQAVDSAAAAVGIYRPVQPSDTTSPLGLPGDSLRPDTLAFSGAASALADTTAADSATLVDSSLADTSRKENALQPVDESEVDDTSLTARMDARRGGGLRREEFPDLLSTAAMTGGYRTFLELVDRSTLRRVLTSGTVVTLLAPTDSAFVKLGEADRVRLRNNSALRDAWLGTLVLNGNLKSRDLVRSGQVRSRGGTLVRFSQTGGVVRAGQARLVQPDLVASNGIMHGVDRVVLPNATSASP